MYKKAWCTCRIVVLPIQTPCFFPVLIAVNINWSLVSTIKTFDDLTFGTLDWENHVTLKKIMKNFYKFGWVSLGSSEYLFLLSWSTRNYNARYFFLSEWRGGQPSVKSLKPVWRNDSSEETQNGSGQTGIEIPRSWIPSFQIDLFSLYVLFSQYRSCDNTLENCFFQISSDSLAYVRVIEGEVVTSRRHGGKIFGWQQTENSFKK